MNADPIRILIADDQALLRHSLALVVGGVPGMVVAGEAASGTEAVTMARQVRPDVVLMDVRMPGGDGIEATAAITATPDLGDTRVLVLTMFELDEYVYGALRAGASGFLLKDARPQDLIDAIGRTHSGESMVAPAILTRLVEHYVARPAERQPLGLDMLTDRETEVLTLIARGLSNDDIADALTISIKTVKTHIGNLLAKTTARDRAQLVITAYEHGLVTAAC
jgi:DNA-binding NarL/FixJ family response regulator